MQDLKRELDAYIAGLWNQMDEQQAIINAAQDVLKDLHTRAEALIEFKNSLAKDEPKAATKVVERQEDMNKVCPKLMDRKDSKKINIFLEFIDKCGGENFEYKFMMSRFHRMHYYLYSKNKLWNGINDFRQDFENWVNREGYWTNALPLRADHEIDYDYPVAKVQ